MNVDNVQLLSLLQIIIMIVSMIAAGALFVSRSKADRMILSNQIEVLEKKMDKHNNLVERVALVEREAIAANKRLDVLCRRWKLSGEIDGED